ncbi:hypothetical protein F4801DRAFT_572014 [Xylaria longipes]|nr:hypothetical protein F4801DRAFT_572014 [Xylaria longipes]
MSNSSPHNIPATATAAAGSSALRRRDRRLRDAARLTHHHTHQEYLRLQAKLDRPLSPSPSASSSSSESEYSASVIAEVEEVLRNHNPYNYKNDELSMWHGLGNLGSVNTEDGRRKTPQEMQWMEIGEPDPIDYNMEQREPDSNDSDMGQRDTSERAEELWQSSFNLSRYRSSGSGEDIDAEGRDIQEQQQPQQTEVLPSLSSDFHMSNVEGRDTQQPTEALSSSSSSSSPQHTSQQQPRRRTSPRISKRSTTSTIMTSKSTTTPILASTPTSASATTPPTILRPRPTRAAMHRISKPRQRQRQTQGQNQRTGRGRGRRNYGQLWELDERGTARRARR